MKTVSNVCCKTRRLESKPMTSAVRIKKKKHETHSKRGKNQAVNVRLWSDWLLDLAQIVLQELVCQLARITNTLPSKVNVLFSQIVMENWIKKGSFPFTLPFLWGISHLWPFGFLAGSQSARTHDGRDRCRKARLNGCLPDIHSTSVERMFARTKVGWSVKAVSTRSNFFRNRGRVE